MSVRWSLFAIECPKCRTRGILYPENFTIHKKKEGISFRIFYEREEIIITCQKCGYKETWNQKEGYFKIGDDETKYLGHPPNSERGAYLLIKHAFEAPLKKKSKAI